MMKKEGTFIALIMAFAALTTLVAPDAHLGAKCTAILVLLGLALAGYDALTQGDNT